MFSFLVVSSTHAGASEIIPGLDMVTVPGLDMVTVYTRIIYQEGEKLYHTINPLGSRGVEW